MSLPKLHARAAACAFAAALAWSLPASIGHTATTASSLPTLGDAARGDLSPIMERKLGEAIMHDIRRNVDYLDDDAISEYLNNFGGALVASVPGARGETNNDYEFFAVRDSMINAFALPGGFIGVHSQLLLAAQTESELASVLSHEIGHVTQRHIARMIGQQKQDMLIPLAGMLLAALASRSSGDAAIGVMMGSQGLALQRQLNFTREAEREADRVGFQIMGQGGYDTSGMVAFFQRLQSANRLYASDVVPPSLLSHPLTTERIADIQARIREMPQRQRIDGLEFHLVRARLRVLQDESSKGRNEAKLAFETQLTQQSRQQQASAQYGLAYLALKQGDLAAAQSWLDKARATMKPVQGAVFSTGQAASDGAAMFSSMDIEIKLAPGQPDAVLAQALKQAKEAHDKYPLSRGIARQYADALIANKKADQAALFLREQAQQYRNEPKLHDLLAKAYAAQGKQALQHMALAESYALGGSLPAAIDQLNIARKAGDASFYDMAVIDARERELQARHREEMKEAKKN